jgi:hypothetical protein
MGRVEDRLSPTGLDPDHFKVSLYSEGKAIFSHAG